MKIKRGEVEVELTIDEFTEIIQDEDKMDDLLDVFCDIENADFDTDDIFSDLNEDYAQPLYLIDSNMIGAKLTPLSVSHRSFEDTLMSEIKEFKNNISSDEEILSAIVKMLKRNGKV